MKLVGFDWDDGNRDKCQKHGVPLSEIEAMFDGTLAIKPDLAHSGAEAWLPGIGHGSDERHIFVAFTIRMQDCKSYLRPMSAATCTARRSGIMNKPVPDFQTDNQAALFVEKADLSRYDLNGFVPTRFEFEAKAAELNIRLPQTLLAAVKAQAKARGIPYTRFVRETLEKAVSVR